MLDLTCILFCCDALAFFRSKTNLDRSKLNTFLGFVQNKSNRSNKCVSSEDFYRSKTILDSFKLFLTRPNCFRQVQTVFYQNKNYCSLSLNPVQRALVSPKQFGQVQNSFGLTQGQSISRSDDGLFMHHTRPQFYIQLVYKPHFGT